MCPHQRASKLLNCRTLTVRGHKINRRGQNHLGTQHIRDSTMDLMLGMDHGSLRHRLGLIHRDQVSKATVGWCFTTSEQTTTV